MDRLRQRFATEVEAGEHVARLTLRRAVELSSVAAIWAAGNAGPVTLAVDGSPLDQLDGGTSGIAVFRFDRPELVPAGATVTVTMPTVGMGQVQGDIR